MGSGVCSNDWLNIINSIVSTIVLIFGTLMLYFLGDMVRDFNPFSTSPLTSPQRTNVILSVVIKILPPLVYQFFSEEYKTLTRWIILALLFLNESYNYYIPVSYKPKILTFYSIVNAVQFWLAFCAFCNYLFDRNQGLVNDNYAAYYMVLGVPFYYFISRHIDSTIVSNYVTTPIKKDSPEDFLRKYLDMLSIKVQQMRKEDLSDFKQGFLSFYNRQRNIDSKDASNLGSGKKGEYYKFGDDRLGPYIDFASELILGLSKEQEMEYWVNLYFEILLKVRRIRREANHAIFL